MWTPGVTLPEMIMGSGIGGPFSLRKHVFFHGFPLLSDSECIVLPVVLNWLPSD